MDKLKASKVQDSVIIKMMSSNIVSPIDINFVCSASKKESMEYLDSLNRTKQVKKLDLSIDVEVKINVNGEAIDCVSKEVSDLIAKSKRDLIAKLETLSSELPEFSSHLQDQTHSTSLECSHVSSSDPEDDIMTQETDVRIGRLTALNRSLSLSPVLPVNSHTSLESHDGSL